MTSPPFGPESPLILPGWFPEEHMPAAREWMRKNTGAHAVCVKVEPYDSALSAARRAAQRVVDAAGFPEPSGRRR